MSRLPSGGTAPGRAATASFGVGPAWDSSRADPPVAVLKKDEVDRPSNQLAGEIALGHPLAALSLLSVDADTACHAPFLLEVAIGGKSDRLQGTPAGHGNGILWSVGVVVTPIEDARRLS
jgi:hypothetical protein